MKLSLVIPAYNEANRIGPTLRNYLDCYWQVHDFELIVVLNGCTDSTRSVVEDFSAANPGLVVLEFKDRIGKGGAIIEGFKRATGDLIGFTDADSSVSADDFNGLVRAIDGYDAVIASRWMAGSHTVVQETPLRKPARWTFRMLNYVLFGVRFKDTQCGAKLFKRHVVAAVIGRLNVRSPAFDVQLICYTLRKGYRIREFPIRWRYKPGTKLKLHGVIMPMLWSLLVLKVRIMLDRSV